MLLRGALENEALFFLVLVRGWLNDGDFGCVGPNNRRQGLPMLRELSGNQYQYRSLF